MGIKDKVTEVATSTPGKVVAGAAGAVAAGATLGIGQALVAGAAGAAIMAIKPKDDNKQ